MFLRNVGNDLQNHKAPKPKTTVKLFISTSQITYEANVVCLTFVMIVILSLNNTVVSESSLGVWMVGSLFYDAFSVTILYGVDDRG
jgi:hypothetical protein